jgi:Tetratricopeptide repeat
LPLAAGDAAMSAEESEPLDLQAAEGFDHLAEECRFHERLTDAASYYRQALAVRERVFGPDHYKVADSLVRLAGIGEDGWGSPEAEALWRRAIGIYDRCYREQSVARGELFQHVFMGLVGTLSNVAGVAFDRGDVGEAERGYRRIGALIADAFGPDCRWMLPTSAFAAALIQQGKQGEAEGPSAQHTT